MCTMNTTVIHGARECAHWEESLSTGQNCAFLQILKGTHDPK